MNEYTVAFPLWWIEGGMVGPDEISLSEGLRGRLALWADHFMQHFDPFDRWDSPEAARAHATMAEQLVTELRSELEPELEVHPQLWELDSDNT